MGGIKIIIAVLSNQLIGYLEKTKDEQIEMS